MPRFPFYNPPFPYYSSYPKKHIPQYNSSDSTHITSNTLKPDSLEKQAHIKPKKEDDYWLDVFGIKLYYDDVLILSLLFFLYKEEVKDEWLFLALVLLLIS